METSVFGKYFGEYCAFMGEDFRPPYGKMSADFIITFTCNNSQIKEKNFLAFKEKRYFW